MIIEFTVENFFSFKEKNTFSMIASSDKLLEENYVKIGNEKILKTTAIYGSNASGKSNLFKILSIVSEMISQSSFNNPNRLLPIVPFKFDKNYFNKPSFFEIKFILDNIKYLYGFKADNKNVYDEYLYYYPHGKPVKIFVRKNINDYEFNNIDLKKLNDIKEKNTSNKFFISTATTWNFEKTKPAYDFLSNKIGVVFSIDQINNFSYNMYSNDKDNELQKFTLNFLKKADLNISGYNVTKDAITEEKISGLPENIKINLPIGTSIFTVNTKHTIGEKEFVLDINEESIGTQIIFSLIPVIRDVFLNNIVLIIDEFDRSLHPFLVKYIVEIFNDENINKNGSQLIFNTHDTNLLDLELLRRDQIWFTEKNEIDGSSRIYPLDDFSVRKSENVEKGYLLGRYGAVPFIEPNIEL